MTKVDRGLAAALAVVAFVGYGFAAAPAVEWLDAGELAAAAYTLGISHPPAQPGHALLGKLITFLPFGEIAFRLSLLSALAGAAAVAGTFVLARTLDGTPRPMGRVVAATGALFVGLSPLVWEQSVRTEVYTPTLALLVWAVVFACRFVLAPPRDRHARDALVASFLFALAATVHPMIAAAMAAPFAVAVAWAAGPRRLVRLGAAALGLGVLALTIYAYLPLRAGAAHPPMLRWGDPSSPERFLAVVTGRAYGSNFGMEGFATRWLGHLRLLGEGTGLSLILLGGAGLLVGTATRRRGAALSLAAAGLLLVGPATQLVFHPGNPDIHGYLVPALPLLVVGAVLLLDALPWRGRLGQLVPYAAFVLLALAALPGRGHDVEPPSRRRTDDATRYVDATLGRMPPGPALYLANSDHALFPALYEQLVAGVRPDIGLGNAALVTSSWFLQMLDRSVPALFVPYVDDGGRQDRLLGRLVEDNLRAGRPVGGERASLGPSPRPMGLGYRYTLATSAGPAAPTDGGVEPFRRPAYAGEIGARVARFVGLERARYELAQGHLEQAARAAEVTEAFGDVALAALRAARPSPSAAPSLEDALPAVTPEFIYAPWRAELMARQVAFAAGLGPGPEPSAEAPLELRLLYAWQVLLASDGKNDVLVAALGPKARYATARMLAARGQLDLAEAQLRKLPPRPAP